MVLRGDLRRQRRRERLKQLTRNSVGDRWPTWTPDGRILFVSNRTGPQDLTNGDASEYYVMDSDGTGIERFRWESGARAANGTHR